MPKNKKIYLDGYIDVPSNRIAEVEAALAIHIVLTREEAGCLFFEVVPSKTIEGRFSVSEIFTNQATFDAHQKRAKASQWFEASEGLVREYNIRVGDEK